MAANYARGAFCGRPAHQDGVSESTFTKYMLKAEGHKGPGRRLPRRVRGAGGDGEGGRNTYKMLDKERFLFYTTDATDGYWCVGGDMSRAAARWRVKSEAKTPDDIEEQWEVRGDRCKAWCAEPSAKIVQATAATAATAAAAAEDEEPGRGRDTVSRPLRRFSATRWSGSLSATTTGFFPLHFSNG